MKYLILALMLLSPVAVSQEIIIKQKGNYIVITPACPIEAKPLAVKLRKAVVDGRLIVRTTKGKMVCKIKEIKKLTA